MNTITLGARSATLCAAWLLTLAFSGVSTRAGAQSTADRYLPLRTVYYFNNYDPTATFWHGGSEVYDGGGAIVKTMSDTTATGLPIQTASDGARAMVLDTIFPSGYWNILFKIQEQPIDLARLGSPSTSVVHFRVKWGNILPSSADDFSISLYDEWNNETPHLPLSHFVTPSTTTWQDVDIPLTSFAGSNVDLTHIIFIKIYGLHTHSAESVIYIDELAVMPAPVGPASLTQDLVKVDQAGWRPTDLKRALLSFESGLLPSAPKTFRVVDATTGATVFQGNLAPATVTAAGFDQSGDTVYNADFTSLKTPGVYQIALTVPPPIGSPAGTPSQRCTSDTFQIGAGVYSQEFRDALRYYYYQRSGEAIVEPYGEGYDRPGQHLQDTADDYAYGPGFGMEPHPAGAVRDAIGGWLDAGDTSVQVHDHDIAIWYLLEAYRDFGDKTPGGSLDLPESTTGVNDILTIVQYGMQWLAKMWNPDGSVQVQVDSDSLVEDADTATTAETAGAFAKAYTLLRTVPQFKAAADSYLAMAKKSWQWLQANPNPHTGADPGNPGQYYPLTSSFTTRDMQARAYAAIELYNATGNEAYNQAFLTAFQAQGGDPVTAFGGLETGYESDHVLAYLDANNLTFGYWDYIKIARAGVSESVKQTLKAAFIHQADTALKYESQTYYDVCLLYPFHFYWGSTENVLSTLATVLTKAYAWTGDLRYRDAALDNLHFINGRNTLDRDLITGETDYLHGCDFYSQFWTDLTQQPPGVAGSFINTDGLIPYVKDPWKRYFNMQDASVCEPDVSWNCETAYLAGYFAQPLPAGTAAAEHASRSAQPH